MILISVIIPFYKGNQYISNLLKCLEKNEKLLEKYGEIEVIIVNDSPGYKLNIDKNIGLPIQVFNNQTNIGIHKTRVNGLAKANGEYVVFLDQDDEIADNMMLDQYTKIKDCDVIVGNGIFEYEKGEMKIYRNKFASFLISNIWPYLFDGCQIVSPGQCLIRKKSIPGLWKEKILKLNGADDFYLWILLIIEKARFKYNENNVYVHKNTHANLSKNAIQMLMSEEMVCDLLVKNRKIGKLKGEILRKRIKAKMNFISSKNMKYIMYNFHIFSIHYLIRLIRMQWLERFKNLT